VTLSVDQVRRVAQAAQPDLVVSQEEHQIVLQGRFAVTLEGFVEEHFVVRIEVPPDFPARWPRTYEMAGRIPRDADRHMYPNTEGLCCVGVWAEWLGTGDRSFERYLRDTVHDFFFGQWFYEQNPQLPERERWPFGERSHGRLGLLESLGTMLDMPATDAAVYPALHYLLKDAVIGPNDPCPCGSKRRFKRCHRAHLWQARKQIDLVTIGEAIQHLRLYT